MRESMQKSAMATQHRSKAPAATMQPVNDVAASPRVVIQRKAMGDGFGGASGPSGGGQGASVGGLPPALSQGIAALSGMDLSDVKVHRDSAKPAQFDASALAQGNEIHLGPGQDRYLPHEAWHIVQQRQGRVSADVQAKGGPLNTDTRLEREADIKGAEAAQVGSSMSMAFASTDPGRRSTPTNGGVVQLGGEKEDDVKESDDSEQLFDFQKFEEEERVRLRAAYEHYGLSIDEYGDLRNRYDRTFDEKFYYSDHDGPQESLFVQVILKPIVREKIIPKLSHVVYADVQREANVAIVPDLKSKFRDKFITKDANLEAFAKPIREMLEQSSNEWIDNFIKKPEELKPSSSATDAVKKWHATDAVKKWHDVRAQSAANKLGKKEQRAATLEHIKTAAIAELSRKIVVEDLERDNDEVCKDVWSIVAERVKESPTGALSSMLKRVRGDVTKFDELCSKWSMFQVSDPEDADCVETCSTEIGKIRDDMSTSLDKRIPEVREYIGDWVFGADSWHLFTKLTEQVSKHRRAKFRIDAIRDKIRAAQTATRGSENDKTPLEAAVEQAANDTLDASLADRVESWGPQIDKELPELDTSVNIDLKHKLNLAALGIPGVYVVLSFKGKASRDEKGVMVSLTGSLGVGVGIKNLFDINATFAGYVKGRGKDATHALQLLVYSMYRRALSTGGIWTSERLDAVFGREGMANSHASWAAAVESQMQKGHSAESGVKVGVGAGIGGKLLGALRSGLAADVDEPERREPDRQCDLAARQATGSPLRN